jgi:Bacterial type II/III secretion system short domain
MAISLDAFAIGAGETAANGAAANATVRVFVLKYKRVEEAALLIRPHLSESASVTLTQRLNAMTVTDREENLKTIARVIAQFDSPPRGFTFAVKLVRARADVPAGTMGREIGGLGAKLKAMFQFNDYALVDSATMQGAEGRSVSYRLGEEYVLTFTIGPAGAGDELLLSPFALSRLKKDDQGRLQAVPLYRAAIPVTLNQTLVVGASKEEGSKNALILILLAQETARPGTPGGKSVEKR